MNEPEPTTNLPPPADIASALSSMAHILAQRKGGGKSRYPYYSERYALEVQETIDKVLESRTPMLWPARGVSWTTLKAKWQQGLDYLINVHDPGYKSLADLIVARAIPRQGMRIEPRVVRSGVNPIEIKDWKPDFIKFIELSQHKDIFERVVPLSDTDVQWIYDQLADIKDRFICEVNPATDKITLIRYDRS